MIKNHLFSRWKMRGLIRRLDLVFHRIGPFRGDFSIPRNVFDCQFARRVSEELHIDSRNLATSWGIHRREGIEKSGSEKQLQTIHLPCFSRESKGKSLDDSNCLESMTHHAVGIGTCPQSGMINPSHPSSEMHLGKFPRPYGISELDCELFEQRFARKQRIPHARCSGSRKSKQPSRWMTSSLQNQ